MPELVKLNIDGREIQAEKGALLIEVARLGFTKMVIWGLEEELLFRDSGSELRVWCNGLSSLLQKRLWSWL